MTEAFSLPAGESEQLEGLPDRLVSMVEVAGYLDVPLSWVKDAVRFRRIRFTRVGKHVRFTHGQVAEIIAAGEQTPIAAQRGPRAPAGGGSPKRPNASRSRL
jgi:excisionase family DNA binding protein